MYHPTSRVLTVLELLQSRPSITGPELAACLEMDVRTVRRYITHLQDVGIPVEGNIGRHGGYRLRPGFKLPPLIFTEEEATSIVLGLLASPWLEIGQSAVAIEGALAKVSRVLPLRARERLQAVSSHLVFHSHHQHARPDSSLVIDISGAIQASQRIAIDYRSSRNESTHRTIEPYSMSGWQGRWYLVGYCCLRQGYRTFRLDRIEQIQILPEIFEKASDFDYEAFMKEKWKQSGVLMEVEFETDLPTVRDKIPALYGTLTELPNGGVLLQERYEDVEGMVRYLMALRLPFIVRNPPELREAFQRMGERMIQIAKQSPGGEDGPTSFTRDENGVGLGEDEN
jgi:predicted DNA-binding transcriptional regulator YafY